MRKGQKQPSPSFRESVSGSGPRISYEQLLSQIFAIQRKKALSEIGRHTGHRYSEMPYDPAEVQLNGLYERLSTFYSDLDPETQGSIDRMRAYAANPDLALRAAREEGITGSFSQYDEETQKQMCVEHYQRTADCIEKMNKQLAARRAARQNHSDLEYGSDLSGSASTYDSDLEIGGSDFSTDLDGLDI